MVVIINGEKKNIADGGMTVGELFDEDTVVIIDGYQVGRDYAFQANDDVIAVGKHEIPCTELLERMTFARNGEAVNTAIRGARVLIAGLGGIGSNLAVDLVRLGIKSLVLIDYDTVDASNINRQCYYLRDLGEYKTKALDRQLKEINPYLNITTVNKRVDTDNIDELLCNCDIVCECFDSPESKAVLVNAALIKNLTVVACSGMAGYGKGSEIITRRVMNKLYLVGDGVSEAKKGCGLMSPRVAICAGHMANSVLRLLMREEP